MIKENESVGNIGFRLFYSSNIIMWLNISIGTSCWKTGFWVMGLQKSKYLKIQSQSQFFFSDFTFFNNLQYLIFKLLEGFGARTVFPNTNTWYGFLNFKSLLLKINFSPVCYNILIEIAISQECKDRFQFFFAPKLSWKNSHVENNKKANFDLLTQLVPFDVLSHIW